ncbi:brachyury protein homolog [Tetranychus urticae]|uniref:T-box domain-containing protein n=1 Tax=Tetranychus urticae TaxID=32264 RepID=T1JYI5_TETUR|nr:brachyury protein homolog [Tetranychus urticae]
MNVLNYIQENLNNNNHNTTDRTISVILLQEELWNKFNSITTEMIVTKSGRRMFPVVKLEVKGLETNSMYVIILEFCQLGDNRWKFVNNEWVQGSKSEVKSRSEYSYYTHPESPNYGGHWMKKPVEFPKVKLTNKQPPEEGQVVLNSLHKYEPKVHIIKSNPGHEPETISFCLPTTQFIAVTAYQNESITDLKIKNNPYAKAFAEKHKKNKNDVNRIDNNINPCFEYGRPQLYEHQQQNQFHHSYHHHHTYLPYQEPHDSGANFTPQNVQQMFY